MIHRIALDNDEATYQLVLEDSFGTHIFDVDPQMLHDALRGWREHMAVGESIRVERLRAGAPSWDEFASEMGDDPGEALRAHGDFLRKQERENR